MADTDQALLDEVKGSVAAYIVWLVQRRDALMQTDAIKEIAQIDEELHLLRPFAEHILPLPNLLAP